MKNEFDNLLIKNQPLSTQKSASSKKIPIQVDNFIDGVSDSHSSFPFDNLEKIYKNDTTHLKRINPNITNSKRTIEVDQIISATDSIDNSNAVQAKSNAPYYYAKKMQRLFFFHIINDHLYVWDQNEGLHLPLNTSFAEHFLRKNVPSEMKPFLNSSFIKEIIKWLEAESPTINSSSYNSSDYFVFNNGLFNLDTFQLEKFNLNYPITNKLSVNYVEEAPYNEHFEKFISDITDGDPLFYNQLQELFGYVLSDMRKLKTLPVLLGPKDSGKSICLKILENLVGEKNSSSISPQQLLKSEFLSELNNKKLNTCGEISSKVNFNIELLKQLTGGDTITSRSLYSDPIKFTNTAAIILAGNSLPNFRNSDSHNALLDRISLFAFNKSVAEDKKDPYLLEKICGNLEYVAHWALNGFYRLINQDFIFSTPTRSSSILNQTKLTTNSLEFFIKHECVFDKDYRIYKEDFIEFYCNYCEENDTEPQSSKEIDRVLIENYSVLRKKGRINGLPPKSLYIGIKIQ